MSFLQSFMPQSTDTQPQSSNEGSDLLGGILSIGGLGGYLEGLGSIYTSIDNMFGGGVGNRMKDTKRRVEEYTSEATSLGGLKGINYFLYKMHSFYHYELIKKWSEPEQYIMEIIQNFESEMLAQGLKKTTVSGQWDSKWVTNRGSKVISYTQFEENEEIFSTISDAVTGSSAMSGGLLALVGLGIFFGMKKFK